ncbi:RNA-dependent RNA polymerase [Paris alphapartitivirus]|nr:RNA-dependent RNA polymerase [Paris alphapartitivirus]
MQNIEKIANLPKLAKPILGSSDPERNPKYGQTVDHALEKFLTVDELNIVIHGYRRSQWNSTALDHDIEALNTVEHKVIKDEHYYNAIRHTYKLFKPETLLRPVHFADLRHYPWQLSTSIGAPFATSKHWIDYVNQKYDSDFKSQKYRDLFKEAHGLSLEPRMIDRRMTKRNLYNEMFYINRKNIHLIKDGWKTNSSGHDLKYWNTAFARQHLVKSNEDDKVRLVFGAPSTLLMAELMFIWPLQCSLLSRGPKSPMLWGFETTTGGWSRIYNWAHSQSPKFETVVTLDWKRFDKDARHSIINDIHSMIMRPMFDFTKGYHPTVTYPNTISTDPQRLENLWNWMTDSITSIPLMLPNGDLLAFKHSGIYSGYFQTQILDSMYNSVMIFTILSKMGFDLNNIHIKVQGDDSIFLLPHQFVMLKPSFLQFFSQYAKEYFGSTINLDKSEILPSLENAEVLKYRNKATMPYRDELQLLAMLRHPERSVSLESLMARAIGIAYSNCGNFTRVHRICEDIYNFLAGCGFTPDPHGLPRGLLFRQNYIPGYEMIDLTHFPTYFDTVRHLQDPSRELLSEKHWPRKHFIGIPGRS